MRSMPLALSVHNFISSVGADAGFAAIIGLAILVLLYFAHARETANLREQAALLTQRLQQAEARVAELTRAHAAEAVQPAPRPVVPVAPVPAGVGAMPGAPAGMAAPPLAAATRVVPLATPPMPARPPAQPAAQPAPQPAGAPVSAALAGAADTPQAPAGTEVSPTGTEVPPADPEPAPAGTEPAAAGTEPAPAGTEPAPAGTEPAPVGADGAPAGADPVPAPEEELIPDEHEAPLPPDGEEIAVSRIGGPATVAGANGSSQETPPVPAGAGLAAAGVAMQSRPASRRPLPPLPPPPQRNSGAGRWLAALIGVFLLAVAIVAVVIVTSNSGTQNPGSGKTTNSPTANAPKHRRVFAPATVTVAVLNGTSTNQLAHQVAARLAAVGYREGTIATAANQTETTTIVSYVSGTADRTDALHVATALKLGRTAVQPINQSAQQVACPPPGACTANVVVTVGADLASS